MQRLQQLNNKISTNQSCIHNYEKRISDLQTLMNKSKDSVDLEGAHSILESLHRDKDSLNECKATQLDERTYNEVISELLKDTGIKTKVIRQYLPIMNKLINQYLQILDFFVSFNLDENFNETIRSRHRDDFSYSSFSEGEKSRIDLSLLFSWRQIAKMKNSSNTNLLILDEVFDSSLDSDGVDNLLKIMATLDADTRIFIISHKQDVLEGKFDQKIEFEKQKNFTAIKEKS
jgi:chromosome segregation ATPase